MLGYGRVREAERRSCSIERDVSKEAKALKNRLMWDACLPHRYMALVSPGLLPMTMFRSLTLLQPQSVTMSRVYDNVHATIRGCEDGWC